MPDPLNTSGFWYFCRNGAQTQSSNFWTPIWPSPIRHRALRRGQDLSNAFTNHAMFKVTSNQRWALKERPRFTWGVPQTELNPLSVNLKTGRVVLKHSGDVALQETQKLHIKWRGKSTFTVRVDYFMVIFPIMLHLNRTYPQPNHASHSQALSSPNPPPPHPSPLRASRVVFVFINPG